MRSFKSWIVRSSTPIALFVTGLVDNLVVVVVVVVVVVTVVVVSVTGTAGTLGTEGTAGINGSEGNEGVVEAFVVVVDSVVDLELRSMI